MMSSSIFLETTASGLGQNTLKFSLVKVLFFQFPLYVVMPDSVQRRLDMFDLFVHYLDGIGNKEKKIGVIRHDSTKDLLLYLCQFITFYRTLHLLDQRIHFFIVITNKVEGTQSITVAVP
jgi:hypothetical protein